MLQSASLDLWPSFVWVVRFIATTTQCAAIFVGYIVLSVLLTASLANFIVTSHSGPVPVHATGAVVVTGASSGIGEHAAATLSASTSLVVYAGVRTAADAERLQSAYPGLRTIFIDVTKPDSIVAAVQIISDAAQPLVGLVNNAGVQVDLPIELQTSEADRFTFGVNVFGLLDTTRAFLPLLRKTGSGARIVNVGSLAGIVATAGSSTYSSSKFAVEGITDSLRREVAPFGISVSLLEPGYVRSHMGVKMHAAREERYGVSADAYELYRATFEGFFATDQRLSSPENAESPATSTTPAILDALLSPSPQTRYPVATTDGIPTRVVIWLQQILPDRVMDALV